MGDRQVLFRSALREDPARVTRLAGALLLPTEAPMTQIPEPPMERRLESEMALFCPIHRSRGQHGGAWPCCPEGARR